MISASKQFARTWVSYTVYGLLAQSVPVDNKYVLFAIYEIKGADSVVVCAIAAKFYKKKPELYLKLASIAKKLAFSVPERGYKSVEVSSAHLLDREVLMLDETDRPGVSSAVAVGLWPC